MCVDRFSLLLIKLYESEVFCWDFLRLRFGVL